MVIKMNDRKKIALLGGDARQSFVAGRLADAGCSVYVWNLPTTMASVTVCGDVADAIDGCSAVILPLPVSMDGVSLNSPNSNITLAELLRIIPDNAIILAGRIPPAFAEACRTCGIFTIDYFDNETVRIKNALLTAEGALMIYMEKLPIGVFRSRILITGWGRVAKCTASVFSALGALVTIAARSDSDLTRASLLGCDTVNILDAAKFTQHLTSSYDCIINTVPARIFTHEHVRNIPAATLFIDLASNPFGVDINEASAHGIEVIRAQSLPGRYAPRSAGEVIFESIYSALRREGMVGIV